MIGVRKARGRRGLQAGRASICDVCPAAEALEKDLHLLADLTIADALGDLDAALEASNGVVMASSGCL